jgi:hydrogenase expression/formation protein HypC
MQVISVDDLMARCVADGQLRDVRLALVGGEVRPGGHLLVHADTAIRQLDADEAELISNALRAVLAASSGASFDHLIADLVDREPPLPDHLLALVNAGGTAA